MSELGADAFDFWIGEWDCEFEGGHAINTISRELDGKVLTERFEMDSPQQYSGRSYSVFHPQLSFWQQTWVDQGGAYWHFVAGLVDGNPSFGTPTPVDDPSLFKRMVFTDITANSLQWRWESSPDLDAPADQWTVNWQISYTRRG